ncbi:hypothetical protein [Parapedobacter soli]|uniref:hypothetical protein n=1 Tax=Parapedobacter soli TaxID=416955 RepID=UPI0021CA1AB5|nr:hypothetical protein [Parapedobacter soli]
MKKCSVKNHQTLRIPTGAMLIDNAEKELLNGGARRPNSIAWKAGKLLIGINLFGIGGILFAL